MIKALFTLLRLGLGNSTLETESLTDFMIMSAEKWNKIGETATNHGVLGIVMDGVDILSTTPYGATRELSTQLKLEWIGQVMMIEEGNRHQMQVMNDLAQKWIKEGCRVMVMKGQVNGMFYPKPEHRSPGDIDCYLFENYQFGNDIAKGIGADVDESWYKHSQISYNGELFENHQYFVHTRGGKRSKMLQNELKNALKVNDWHTFPDSGVLLPPIQWNAMFLTYHACAHFISEGLMLKQLLDWAMFLKFAEYKIDWQSFYEFCDRYHYRHFVDAITSICVEKLGVKLTNTNIVAKSEYSNRIIQSIFENGSICRSGDWNERIQIVKALFHNRWKYEEIYNESVWKQLWYYASGYLFKTEN